MASKKETTKNKKVLGIKKVNLPYWIFLVLFLIAVFLGPDRFVNLIAKSRAFFGYNQNNFTKPKEHRDRIILAGDGGKITNSVIGALKSILESESKDTKLIYLGDNVYDYGIPSKDNFNQWQHANDLLMKQILSFEGITSQIYFIPGNHDWDWHQKDGWQAIKRQGELVENSLGKGHMIPAFGCPGPVQLNVIAGIQIIALDTQWWLHQHSKPTTISDGCETYTQEQVLDKLDKLLRETPSGIETLFITHHPLVSYGNHGVGNDCPADLYCPAYLNMRDKLFEILEKHRPLICAAGHDHNIQVINKQPGCRYYLVSGATSNYTKIKNRSGSGTLFSLESLGFVYLELNQKNNWELIVVSVQSNNWLGYDSSNEVFRLQIN